MVIINLQIPKNNLLQTECMNIFYLNRVYFITNRALNKKVKSKYTNADADFLYLVLVPKFHKSLIKLTAVPMILIAI